MPAQLQPGGRVRHFERFGRLPGSHYGVFCGDMAAENSDFAQVLAEEFGDGGMDFGAFAAQLKQEKEGGNKSSKGK